MDTDEIIKDYITENADTILSEELSVLKKFPSLIGKVIEFHHETCETGCKKFM